MKKTVVISEPKIDRKTRLLRLFERPSVKALLSAIICIAGGILIGEIVLIMLAAFTEDIPFYDAFSGLGIILGGPLASGSAGYSVKNLGNMLFQTTPVLMTGLSVAIAFKTGLFNIGTPGQYLIGGAATMIVALSVPTGGNAWIGFLVWLLALVVGMLCGALWGAIPGIFKAWLGVNEVIVCIMTNWIAANLVSWIFSASGDKFINIAETKVNFLRKTSSNGVMTPRLGLDKIFPGSDIDISIFIAIVFALGIYILLNKTVLGYELKACGFNKNAARYAGMSEKRNIVLSMMIAGALAAGGAALWYLNGTTDFRWETYQTLPNDGFNGIPIALLAVNNPIGVIFSALFLRWISMGGFNLAGFTGFNEYVSDLIIAVIIYFAGFSKFIGDILASKKKIIPEPVTVDAAGDEKKEEVSESEE